ncbi:MAG: peptidoglycan DD-metalloendopeptidase family protein [Pseudomonadota bacterium]
MINYDLKDKKSLSLFRRPANTQGLKQKWQLYLRALLLCFGVLAILIAFFSGSNEQQTKKSQNTYLSGMSATLHLIQDETTPAHQAAEKVVVAIENLETQPVTPEYTSPEVPFSTMVVKSGDSLARLFSRAKLSPRELHHIMSLGEATAELKKVHPGDTIYYHVNADNQLTHLKYELDKRNTLVIERNASEIESNPFAASLETINIDTRQEFATGVIKSSLFMAAKEAGLSNRLVIELANIFQWDIDFVLDIRENDRFSVIFEKEYIDGEFIGNGDIVAAQFINQGHSYTAVRYRNSRGETSYYSPDGRSMRKAFLRAPVNFSRISGNFSLRRKHPVLNRIRAHRGVDYAAPTGTPVRASGDGKVHFKGKKGGFGNLIVLNHGQSYQSKYAHLSRFAKGVRSGKHVKQGQIIGFVGSTGLATGPHLHYEFLVNGVHRNPRTVKLPNAKPIAKSELARFKSETESVLAHLQVKQRIFYAELSNNNPDNEG